MRFTPAQFCLAPAGYGFSSRQYEGVLVGCAPLVIQDDVEMAFEEVIAIVIAIIEIAIMTRYAEFEMAFEEVIVIVIVLMMRYDDRTREST